MGSSDGWFVEEERDEWKVTTQR